MDLTVLTGLSKHNVLTSAWFSVETLSELSEFAKRFLVLISIT